jgi:hypothetical protein
MAEEEISKEVGLKIPYGKMETELCDWLDSQDLFPKSDIHAFFLGPWKDDMDSARIWEYDRIKTWEDYKYSCRRATDYRLPLEILFQTVNGVRVSDDIIKKYMDLGIHRYVVTNDATAYRIHELDPEAFVTASMTKLLKPEQIMNDDLSMYDEICLFFWYAQALDVVKTLPKKYEYSLIGGMHMCYTQCTACITHWYEHSKDFACPYRGSEFTGNDITTRACSFTNIDYQKFWKPYLQRVKIYDRNSDHFQVQQALEDFFRMGFNLANGDWYFNKGLEFPDIPRRGIFS